MVAKGKYEQWLTEEGLLQLEAWARNGLTDEQIAEIAGDSALVQSAYKMLDNAYLTFNSGSKNRVFAQNGLSPVFHNKLNWLNSFSSSNPSTRISAEDFYKESCSQIIKLWDNLMKGVK